MPTTRQKKLAAVIVENATLDKPLNGGEMVEKVGYAKSLVDYPKKVIETEGVREALEDLGFTEENAKKVVAQILLNEEAKDENRLRAAQEVFKVRGTYAPEKSVNVNLSVDKETEEIAKSVLVRYLNGRTADRNK